MSASVGSLCLSRSDQLVFVGGIVSVHPRELLTSPGDRMQVGLTIEMFQLRSSGVKASGASREFLSLAMRCVALALSQTWTQNLMIETCCQKPMKTPNGHKWSCFSQGGASQTKNGSLASTVLSQVLEMLVDAPNK